MRPLVAVDSYLALRLDTYISALSNPSAAGGLSRLVLGTASSLDAFRSYQLAHGYAARVDTTARPEAPVPRSSLKLKTRHGKI